MRPERSFCSQARPKWRRKIHALDPGSNGVALVISDPPLHLNFRRKLQLISNRKQIWQYLKCGLRDLVKGFYDFNVQLTQKIIGLELNDANKASM